MMTVEQFVKAIADRLSPFHIERMFEQPGRPSMLAGWLCGNVSAPLYHYPENPHYPVSLGFATTTSDAIITADATIPSMPLHLQMNDYNARTAAIEILKNFQIEFDPDKLM